MGYCSNTKCLLNEVIVTPETCGFELVVSFFARTHQKDVVYTADQLNEIHKKVLRVIKRYGKEKRKTENANAMNGMKDMVHIKDLPLNFENPICSTIDIPKVTLEGSTRPRPDKMTHRATVSNHNLIMYCKALSRSLKNTNIKLFQRDVDITKLTQKLMKYQVIYSEDYDISKCKYWKKICHFLHYFGYFFKHITCPFWAKDKLKIAKKCFERLEELSDNQPNVLSPSKRITRNIVVDSAISVLRKSSDDEWIPPAFLELFVKQNRAFFKKMAKEREAEMKKSRKKRIRKPKIDKNPQPTTFKYLGRDSLRPWTGKDLATFKKHARKKKKGPLEERSQPTAEPQQAEEEPEERSVRGWDQEATTPKRLSTIHRRRTFNYVPTTPAVPAPGLFDIEESPEGHEETLIYSAETVGSATATVTSVTPLRVEDFRNVISPIKRRSLQREKDLSAGPQQKRRIYSSPELLEDSEVPDEDSGVPEEEPDDLGHLRIRIADIPRPRRWPLEEGGANLSWAELFR